MYKYIIFDVDDTLLDYGSAYRDAQKTIAMKLGIEYTAEYIALDDACGWKAWRESGLDNTDSADVQAHYHVYYRQYIQKHFQYLLTELDISMDVQELTAWYVDCVSGSKVLMEPDTLRIYTKLAEQYSLVLATNGVEEIQSVRISDFLPYTYRVFISETIGYIKPSAAYFAYLLQDLACTPAECLMVGDSLTNDILGAKTAGMDVCYYNRKKKAVPDGVAVTYEIQHINELAEILMGDML